MTLVGGVGRAGSSDAGVPLPGERLVKPLRRGGYNLLLSYGTTHMPVIDGRKAYDEARATESIYSG